MSSRGPFHIPAWPNWAFPPITTRWAAHLTEVTSFNPDNPMQHKIFSGSRQCRAHTPVPATRLSHPANRHLLFWWLLPPSFRADCTFCTVTMAFSPPQNTLHFYLTFILLPPLPLCNLTLLSWIKGSQHAEIFSLSGSYFFSFLIFHPKWAFGDAPVNPHLTPNPVIWRWFSPLCELLY